MSSRSLDAAAAAAITAAALAAAGSVGICISNSVLPQAPWIASLPHKTGDLPPARRDEGEEKWIPSTKLGRLVQQVGAPQQAGGRRTALVRSVRRDQLGHGIYSMRGVERVGSGSCSALHAGRLRAQQPAIRSARLGTRLAQLGGAAAWNGCLPPPSPPAGPGPQPGADLPLLAASQGIPGGGLTAQLGGWGA